jgi:hypothetical protein
LLCWCGRWGFSTASLLFRPLAGPHCGWQALGAEHPIMKLPSLFLGEFLFRFLFAFRFLFFCFLFNFCLVSGTERRPQKAERIGKIVMSV